MGTKILDNNSFSTANELAYFAPVEPGGLADYAICHVRALADAGARIVFLGYPFIRERIESAVPSICFIELALPCQNGGRFTRVLSRIRTSRRNVRELETAVSERSLDAVLISSFVEYFAPFWVRPLRRLSRSSVRFGVVVHDPVRDFVLGPMWWHRFSISQAYSFISTIFVHEAGDIDLGWPLPSKVLEQVVVPHGPYVFPMPLQPPEKSDVREHLHIPNDATVLLSFGHIRDGKNLDSVIRALVQLPNYHLIIAGKEQSSAQRTSQSYQELATDIGVSNQCHWHVRFIGDEEVHKFFIAADAVVLLYSSDFRSASGVLNASGQFGLPVVASSGAGPLKSTVKLYKLGAWLEPNELNLLADALENLFRLNAEPNWDQYLTENSWRQNAETVLSHLANSNESFE